MPKTTATADGDRHRRRQLRGKGETVDWAMQDPLKVLALIAAVASAGGAIRFGYTRTGDALAVGYLGDGSPYTDFLRPTDDVEQYLIDTTASWNGEAPG
jgi:hypothetical protein